MNKQINEHNWLEPDDAIKFYVNLASHETAKGRDWLQPILQSQLRTGVPQEVQDLFEGARGAFIYGYFYYRLYFLGITELYRAAEAAVAHKCTILNAPKSARKFGATFDENIKWLDSQGVLKQADWDHIRDGRNFASHLRESALITPAMAILVLEGITNKINALYPN